MEARGNVLVIGHNPDDEALILGSLKKIAPSITVEVAQTVDKAFDYLFRTGEYRHRLPATPKLILLDLSLPNKSGGLEILRVLKAYSRTQNIPIVVFTPSAQDKAILNSYNLGANSYVEKSANVAEFTRTLEHVLFYWLEVNRQLLSTQEKSVSAVSQP